MMGIAKRFEDGRLGRSQYPRGVSSVARAVSYVAKPFTSRLPHTRVYPVSFFSVGMAVLFAAWLDLNLFVEEEDVDVSGIALWELLLFISGSILIIAPVAFPLSIYMVVMERYFYASSMYYYSTGMLNALLLVIWASANALAVYILFHNNASSSLTSPFYRVCLSAGVIGATYLLNLIVAKILISVTRRKAFWTPVRAVLKKENLLYRMLRNEVRPLPTHNKREDTASTLKQDDGVEETCEELSVEEDIQLPRRLREEEALDDGTAHMECSASSSMTPSDGPRGGQRSHHRPHRHHQETQRMHSTAALGRGGGGGGDTYTGNDDEYGDDGHSGGSGRVHRRDSALRAYAKWYRAARQMYDERIDKNHFLRYNDDSSPSSKAFVATNELFSRLGKSSEDFIVPGDMQRLFEDDEKALRAFKLLDQYRSGSVSMDGVREALTEVYEAARNLHSVLNDRESVAQVVRASLNVVWGLMVCPMLLWVWDIDTTQLAVAFGAFVVSFSFVFGNTAMNTFENVLFLYWTRPFGVGDRIRIRAYPESTLIVAKIHLFSVVTHMLDGQMLIVPTEQLRKTDIMQLSRSEDFAASVQVLLNAQTSQEALQRLKRRLKRYMAECPAPWQVGGSRTWLFYVKYVENPNKMCVCLWAKLEGITWKKRAQYLGHVSNLYLAIQRACTELGIEYQLPPQDLMVSVRDAMADMPGTTNLDSSIYPLERASA